MILRSFLVAATGLLVAWPAAGHGLRHTVGVAPATVVTVEDDDGRPFGSVAYEVYREGEAAPYQTGRTDERGRVVFLPDGAGRWRVKLASADGHGLTLRLTTDAAAVARVDPAPVHDHLLRLGLGVVAVLGLFGWLGLAVQRRRKP